MAEPRIAAVFFTEIEQTLTVEIDQAYELPPHANLAQFLNRMVRKQATITLELVNGAQLILDCSQVSAILLRTQVDG